MPAGIVVRIMARMYAWHGTGNHGKRSSEERGPGSTYVHFTQHNQDT